MRRKHSPVFRSDGYSGNRLHRLKLTLTDDPSLSTSDRCYLTPTFHVTYGDGTDIDRYYCTETVQVAELTVKNLTIGVPQTATGEFTGDYGILGLAFKSGQSPSEKTFNTR